MIKEIIIIFFCILFIFVTVFTYFKLNALGIILGILVGIKVCQVYVKRQERKNV
jgi:uncharacterized protein YqfA (UPF0365 family)